MREALYSIWADAVPGARVLDLYCGAAAVALEALSRGAHEAVAVDTDPRALRAVAANRDALGADTLIALRLSLPDQLQQLAGAHEPFDLVFADPPYELRDYEALLIAAAPLVRPDGELTLEHAAATPTPEAAGPLIRIDRRTYGGSSISRYRHPSQTPAGGGRRPQGRANASW